MSDREIDEVSGVETTGHSWDGIRELNNPLPRWWLWTFYATIVFAIGYTILYPAWPLVHQATGGVFGYSSRAEGEEAIAAGRAAQQKFVDAINAQTVDQIAADDNLREFAVAAGSASFRVNCTPCHGSGAAGGNSYPNLNDDDWLWGGSLDAIYQTISHGIRAEGDPGTRYSEMPAFGSMLKPDQIDQVAAYVVSLSGTPRNPSLVEAGKAIFDQNCVSCHGPGGKGGRNVGAPNLADAIWLYGSGEAAIAQQVRAPRKGVMPAWHARLGDTAVKELTVFVHSLGGGE